MVLVGTKVLLAVTSLAILLSLSIPSSGADKVYHIAGYDTTIIVQGDGTLRITERIAFSFDQGTFAVGYRDIPWRGFDELLGISVRDESGTLVPFRSWFQSDLTGEWHIEWTFAPSTGPVVRIFTLSYTVTSALQQTSPDRDLLDWQAVGSGWSVPIDRVDVNVTLEFPVNASRVQSSPTPGSVLSRAGSYSLLYNASGLPRYSGFRTLVGFPAVAGVTYGPMRIMRDSPIATGLLTFLIVFTIMGLLWVVRGRDPLVWGRTLTPPGPPSDLTPEEVAYLLTQKVWMPGALGGLFRLAKRGYLQFHGVLSGPDASSESPARPIELTPNGTRVLLEDSPANTDLPPHERLLLSAVAANDENPLMEVGRKLPSIEAEVSRRLASVGLLEESAQAVRRRYTLVAFVLFSVGLFLAISAIWTPITFSLRGILAGVCLSSIPVGVVARYMPRLTRKGAEERRRWLAFLDSIRDRVEGSSQRPLDSVRALDGFMEYAPLIPGIDFRAWLSRLGTRFSGVPYLPTWFVWYRSSTESDQSTLTSPVDGRLSNLDLGGAISSDFVLFAKALATNLRISRTGRAEGSEGTGGFFGDSGGGGFGGGGSGGGGGGGGGGAR